MAITGGLLSIGFKCLNLSFLLGYLSQLRLRFSYLIDNIIFLHSNYILLDLQFCIDRLGTLGLW